MPKDNPYSYQNTKQMKDTGSGTKKSDSYGGKSQGGGTKTKSMNKGGSGGKKGY